MKSWSPATLILTAVILVSIVIDLKLLPALKSFHISYAVWAFQNSNLTMYHLTTKCNQKKKEEKCIYFYQAINNLYRWIYIRKKVFLFYLVSLFACLQSLWIYHIWMSIILYYSGNEWFFYCAVWRAFCCTNVRKCYMFMHIWSIPYLTFWKLTHIVSIHTGCCAC